MVTRVHRLLQGLPWPNRRRENLGLLQCSRPQIGCPGLKEVHRGSLVEIRVGVICLLLRVGLESRWLGFEIGQPRLILSKLRLLLDTRLPEQSPFRWYVEFDEYYRMRQKCAFEYC